MIARSTTDDDRVFLDTSYLLALVYSREEHHAAVSQHWKTLHEQPVLCVTTTYVFDETMTYLAKRDRHDLAVPLGRMLLTSARIVMTPIDEAFFRAGWELFQRYSDQRASFTDCVSFAVMQETKLSLALTLDRDFIRVGFQTAPPLK